MHQGVLIRGRMLGSRQQNTQGRNGPITRHEIGIAISRSNGFGGFQEEQIVVRVPNALAQAGIPLQANSMIDKLVEVSVWLEAWSGQRGANVTYHMSNDGVIRNVANVEKGKE
ncbi:DNA-binding protein [Aeromonas hydrophila]|uniref:DNA-binding protein n=1 Tax=Aeromonas hydrophila TaxID=644 RepID=UPI002B4932A9|nr:DNA-binding protein [Aeromonas hydrophila]